MTINDKALEAAARAIGRSTDDAISAEVLRADGTETGFGADVGVLLGMALEAAAPFLEIQGVRKYADYMDDQHRRSGAVSFTASSGCARTFADDWEAALADHEERP